MWKPLAFAALMLAAPVAAAADSGPVVLKALGAVEAGADKDGHIWFSFQSVDQRFVMDDAHVPDGDAVFVALKASSDTGRSLTVHYDPDTAIIDPATSIPTYVARDIVYDGKTIAGDTVSPARDAGTMSPREQSQFALAHGVAYSGIGDDAAALRFLNLALGDSELPLPLRVLALKTRTNVVEGEALGDWPVGDDRDKLLIAALVDARAWAKLAPDAILSARAVAYVLSELGAYDEALDTFAAIYRKWPDDRFRTLTGIGATRRLKGDMPGALAALDQIVAEEGPQDGMAYHYHRGWTLSEMGRYDEAVMELTAGLTTQPDYAWAFIRRSCGYAALGQLREALADNLAAIKIQTSDSEGAVSSPSLVQDNARMKAVTDMLVAAIKADEHQKITGLCTGYWDGGDIPRARSKLLSSGAN